MPTSKSATARLTMKKFVTLRSLCEQNTAAITKQLPTMTSTSINSSTLSDTILLGSVHCTYSQSVQSDRILLLLIVRCVSLFGWRFSPSISQMMTRSTERDQPLKKRLEQDGKRDEYQKRFRQTTFVRRGFSFCVRMTKMVNIFFTTYIVIV